MLNHKTKVFLYILTVSSILLMPKLVLASCNYGGTVADRTRSVTFGNVIVQRDTPVGQVIAKANTGEYKNGEGLMGCTENWSIHREVSLFTQVSSYGNNVYDTNIAGVGIRMFTPLGLAFPVTSDIGAGSVAIASPGIQVELVKTSAAGTGAGSLTTGRLGGYRIVSDPSFFTSTDLTGNNVIIPVACSVNNTVINVSLDDAVYSDFSGVGSTAKPKDFNIGLNCDAGTNVKLTLDGNAAGPAGVLALNAGSNQAKGIGIQLVKSAAPIALGTPLDFGTATSAGDMQLPLIARYYQTEASITGGTTNTTATFTMTYN